MPVKSLITSVLLLCLWLDGMFLCAQDQPREISINADSLPLEEVLGQVEEQSGLRFSYSSRLLDENETVSIYLDGVSLEEALEEIFGERPIRYQVLEKQIVLKRARRALPPAGAGTDPDAGGEEGSLQFTISGYVRDALSGEVLIGATVSVPGSSRGTISNSYGFYSLTLKEKASQLICSFVGYRREIMAVEGNGNQVFHFAMQKEVSRLSEVTVYSGEETSIVRQSRSSEDRIRVESVRMMPALFGEKDVIKSLAAIPGIKFFGDGSTIFFVRGGGRDQNLVTIDEAPVYNPTHLLGFFSTVVPDAVKDIRVYKGDFPANYGGRLSSLIDIRTKDGNMKRFGMDASVGLLSSRLSLEGPLWKDHISFFASGRRSYILKPIQRFNEDLRDLHFSDLHLKLNYRINSNNRIYFSMYRGEDNYEQGHPNGNISGINWINNTATLRWNHLWSDRLFSNLTLLASSYDYYLNTDLEARDFWQSHVDNGSIKYDLTYYIRPSWTLRFGVLSAVHFHNPGNYYLGGVEHDPGLDLSTKRTRELAAYVSNQFIFNEKLSLRLGIRFTSWQNIGPATEYTIIPAGEEIARDSLAVSTHPEGEVYHTSLSADPRLSMIWRPADPHVFKASYSRTSQFQYLITNSISPFTSLEVWLPASPNVKPQVAHQFTLGYSHYFNGPWHLDVEAYYKKMLHLIDYRDHARMLLNPLVEYELRFGEGKAYGLEFSLNKGGGRLSGWLSYTLSRAIYRVGGINFDNPYPAYSDRPHDFSAFLSWAFGPRLSLTANFIYMTGAPFTTPTAYYYYHDHQVPVYAERNNDRLPDYHRLDLALNWQLSKPGRRFQHELIFSVYNFYNRKNPVALHFNKIEGEDGNFVVPYDFYDNPELVSTQYYLYGMVPSLSYHFHF